MSVKVNCDTCAREVDDVLCDDCRPVPCDNCKKKTDRLLCEACAEEEFECDEDHDLPPEFTFNEDDLINLTTAIRRGDMAEAELSLDRLGGDISGWTDVIQTARYSPAARRAAQA